MSRLPLALPPGVYRDGTQYQSKGRYADAWLTRWYGSALGPINGWRRKGTGTLTGAARAALAWKANDAKTWLGIGTHSKLFVSDRAGALSDITPVGFTAGRADAIAAGGYGTSTYGTSTYGTPRPDTSLVLDATQWTLDSWGEYLLGVSPDDRKLYQWQLNTSVKAAPVTNAPACSAVVTTAERFVFALATADPRTVDWCDQENNTVWAPSSTNQAGSFPLQTAGRLMCGCRVRGLTLLFTDLDVHAAQYIGGTLVYGFDRVGDGCGVISRQGVASFGTGEAAWLSPTLNFWLWNGGNVAPLQCDVLDYIRQDINLLQISKTVAIVNAANFEIEWRYCSNSSSEIDRCVVWQYKDNYWNIGRVARTCGVDKGVFQYPILIASDGKLYDHELGWAYDGVPPYLTSGPIELGNGDSIMHVLGLYPDDATVGDVTASFTVRRNPDDVGTAFGPYSLTSKTDLRFSGGQVQMTITGAAMTNWRVGIPKLEIMQGEARG
ncbi:MAG TPA: hypothetical protein VJS47_00415 [Rhizomicrobium sp.]|nr:hypothetical protein [Rhizomicrobium sp.]